MVIESWFYTVLYLRNNTIHCLEPQRDHFSVPRMDPSDVFLEAHLDTPCQYFSSFSHRFLLTQDRFQNLFSTIRFRCVPTVMMPLAHRLDGETGAPNIPFKTCMPSAASAHHITSHHLYWELCII